MTQEAPTPKAKFLTERSVFGLECLLFVRRLTDEQMQRLLYAGKDTGTKKTAEAMRQVRRRWMALQLVESSYLDAMLDTLVLAHTNKGFVESFRRCYPERVFPPARTRVAPETMRHQLELAELFVSIATARARRWQDVRDCVASFHWSSFDIDVRISRREEDVDGRVHERATVPDAVLTTHAHRFLIEVERSTKTLDRVVQEKARPYNAVFSTASVRGNKTPYQQKFSDARSPVIVFAVCSSERAANLKRLLHGDLRVPAFFVGDRKEVAAFLRNHIDREPASSSEPEFLRLARESIDYSVATRKMSPAAAQIDLLRALTQVAFPPSEAADRLRALDFLKRAASKV
jgi:hypothetical protein